MASYNNRDEERFVDYCMDPTGRMQRVVLNERTGKLEYQPI